MKANSAPKRRLDAGSVIVASITLILFLVALFVKGFSHDLLLEAGVFLVSVKLMIMAHKNSAATRDLVERIEDLRAALRGTDEGPSRTGDPSRTGT